MFSFDDIKLTKPQLEEVLECLPNNFIQQEKKLYVKGLSYMESESFDAEEFVKKRINNLFDTYKEIIVTAQDKVYGLSKGNYQFLTHEPCIYDAAKQLFPHLIPHNKK